MHSTLLFAYSAVPELGMHTLTRTDYMPPAGSIMLFNIPRTCCSGEVRSGTCRDIWQDMPIFAVTFKKV